ncbi:MAG: TIGR02452 family protein [Bacillota bacterium]|nr:TIGR02452 family protein [Bacillota bacterium]
MGRTENIAVFEDTARLCRDNETLAQAVKTTAEAQKILLEGDSLPSAAQEKKYDTPAHVIVSTKRSYVAASAYCGKKVCVLNFASATNPGGGVTRGASAQEECLCRCSSLYPNLDTPKLWNDFYRPHRQAANPLYNDDCIYTPDVMVFKTDTAHPEIMEEADWFQVNVITCAAPNLREKPSNAMNPMAGTKKASITPSELLALHEKRLRRILDLAAMYENEVVILGAFGCGAFQNDPNVVALAMKHVLPEYLHVFRTIEFAVYCNPKDDSNYRIFHRTLKDLSR